MREGVEGKLTPSAFQKEMSLTIKQRLASTQEMNLPQVVQLQDKSKTSITRRTQGSVTPAAGLDHSSPQPCPPEVMFHNYSPAEVCEVPLALRSRDEDYFHQLLCTTEREEFIVPICAIVSCAILDSPGQLDFSLCWVKCSTLKALLVGNQGSSLPAEHPEVRQYHRIYQQQRQKLYGFLKEREVDITCRERLALLNHTFQSEITKIRGDPMLLEDDIFSLEPKEGEIRPNCSAEISVFFKPQETQVYNQAVYCGISGRENRLPLLLKGEGLGPRVHFHFEEMNIGEVFIRATHRYEAYLINDGPIEAPFKLIPPTTAMGSCFTFLPQEGIVAPEEVQVIQVSFCPTIRGEFEEEFCFHVTECPKPVTFTMRGSVMGPTFHFDVSALHFGDMAFGLLVPQAGKGSCWRIEPSKGVVPPNSEVSVAVIANLNDTVKFQEKVKVFIENSPVTIVSLQAVGIGTTVVTDKPLVPKLDLKSCFSFSRCFYHFQLTNKGRRIQRLYWSTEGFHTFHRSSRAPAPTGTKGKGAPQIPRPGSPVFKLSPMQVELRPGQTVDMMLEGCSSTVQEVKEQLVCHAVVGKETTKKQILQVDVICNFICPEVQISPRAIAFRVEKKPSDVLTLQYQPLTLKNTSSLPFSIVLDLEQPFQICNVKRKPLPANSQPLRVDVGKELHLCIRFNPAYKNNMISWVVKKVLRGLLMKVLCTKNGHTKNLLEFDEAQVEMGRSG
ncbi:hydrocephalus-inducing protein homolog [Camarhynchus parvulus]|uniref:hydrocephalus-inducing protein homolog n=1 Tax=Geospiza parvula TaxID=87175 RepID=UPI001237A750|nr:hydrocephalus-inducing protein homolog [Camarhynchus parvulus]